MKINQRWLQILENENNNQIIAIIIYKSTVIINPSRDSGLRKPEQFYYIVRTDIKIKD